MREEQVYPGNVVFNTGDACEHVYFVSQGKLEYSDGSTEHRFVLKKTNSMKFLFEDAVQTVRRGCTISEPALWTPWQHTGRLSSVSESFILKMSAELFMKEVMLDDVACSRATQLEWGRAVPLQGVGATIPRRERRHG